MKGVLAAFILALASAPAAQTFTFSAAGDCGGTAANCGRPGNRDGDRDTTWPGLQVDEGDLVTFSWETTTVSGSTEFIRIRTTRTGSAFNNDDLRNSLGRPFPSALNSVELPGTSIGNDPPVVTQIFQIANDSIDEGDETLTIRSDRLDLRFCPTDCATLSLSEPRSITVTIRGTDTAPAFGTVSAQTFTVNMPITEFQIPIGTGGNGPITYSVSGLPAGLTFDADGSGDCPSTEPRAICGTPTAATAGAQTVTLTATDADMNTANSDQASLTFSVTVNPGTSLASSPLTLTETNLNGTTLTVTLLGVTYAAGLSPGRFELVTNPNIAGLSINSVSGGGAGETTATLTLTTNTDYAGINDNATATLAVRVLATAHSGSSNLTTATLSVSPSLLDIDNQAGLTATDALLLFQHSLRAPRLSGDQAERADAWRQDTGRALGGDINGDNQINEHDALIMVFAYQFEHLLQNSATLRRLYFNGLRGHGRRQMPPTDATYREFLKRALQLRNIAPSP